MANISALKLPDNSVYYIEDATARQSLSLVSAKTSILPSSNGTNGQLLKSNGDGTSSWTTQGSPTDSQVSTAVNSWLDDNVPTGTTVVVDKSLSIENAAAESTTVGNLKTYVERLKKLAVHNKVENQSIVSFSDGADDFPIDELVVEIKPIQSGSGIPSPTNVRPISGWTGVNVTRTGKIKSGSDLTVLDGYISTVGYYQTSSSGSKSVTAFVKAGRTKISKIASSTFRIGLFSAIPKNSTQSISSVDVTATETEYTVSVPNDCYLVVFVVNSASSSDISHSSQIIESVKIYENADVYPISLPTTAYGGTLTVNKDGTGTLVVDMAYADLTGKMFYTTTQTETEGRFRFATTDNQIPDSLGRNADIICSHYKGIVESEIDTTSPWVFCASDSALIIQTLDASINTTAKLADFLTAQSNAGNPVTICYKIKTPQTYSLTSSQICSLLGLNNIWADSGNVLDVTYYVDTKLYIDKKLTASRNLMELIITANHEDSMKATKAYTTGNLLIVNGTLYKATTSIANGATLTVGTNVTATTVAAELASLA